MRSFQRMLSTYLRATWRRRWYGIIIAWLVCLIGWAGLRLIPNQYESSARMFVDSDAILTPLLRGIAADSSPTTQLEVIQRTLLSKPNLDKLITLTGLDLTLNGPSDRERMIKGLQIDIKVVPQTKNLFTISYRGPTPRLAHDVVQSLINIFIEQATGSNRADMENARHFLERQIASYEVQLRAAERRRAEFRVKNMEILPNDLTPNVGALESARSHVMATADKLQDAIIGRDALRLEVANTPPMLLAEGGIFQPNTPSGKTRLQEAQEKMQSLMTRYTDQYPEVMEQQKLIDYLKEHPDQPDTTKKLHGKVVAAAMDGTITPKRSIPNPVYDQLKVKLIDAESQVASLTRQHDEAMQAQDRLQKTSLEQPGLFAEYQNMDRDYNVLRKNYEDLLGRLQSANIAQAADTQADKVKLQIIDPAEVPRIPVAPNRPLLATGVLFGGMAVGLGFAVLLSQLDRSFSTVEDLRSLGLPVIGGISMASLPSLRQRLMIAMRFSLAVFVLMMAYGAVMVHILRGSSLI